jgi:hypothetical protein
MTCLTAFFPVDFVVEVCFISRDFLGVVSGSALRFELFFWLVACFFFFFVFLRARFVSHRLFRMKSNARPRRAIAAKKKGEPKDLDDLLDSSSEPESDDEFVEKQDKEVAEKDSSEEEEDEEMEGKKQEEEDDDLGDFLKKSSSKKKVAVAVAVKPSKKRQKRKDSDEEEEEDDEEFDDDDGGAEDEGEVEEGPVELRLFQHQEEGVRRILRGWLEDK